MKKFICTALLITGFLMPSSTHAISIAIFNDDNDQINVRVSFTEKDTETRYWSDWSTVGPQEKTIITSKNPTDSMFSFAILSTQAGSIALNKNPEGIKGRVFLLSQFRSSSSKQFEELPHNARITIRDAKIEVSTMIREENMYWTGVYSRR